MTRRPYKLEFANYSRQWWLGVVKNFLWVALVTVLIWIYADMKFTDTKTLPMTVHLTADSLALMSNDEVRVIFKIEGSRETLDRYEREMKNSMVFDVSKELDPGEHRLMVLDIINNDPNIAKAGLRVTSTDPKEIGVVLERQVHQDMPVELEVSGAELADMPTRTVGITVAESNWNEILARQPKPVLKTKEKDLKNKEPGKPIVVTFEIIPEIAGIPVKLDQSTIEVPVEITQRTDKKKLTVSVRVLALPDWEDARKYDLVRKDPLEWRPEITVSGARTDLDKLDAREVDAYVVLHEDDKKFMETWTTRTVQVRFPPGLQVQIDGPLPQVSFRLDTRPEVPPRP
jgi:hypothetical protein